MAQRRGCWQRAHTPHAAVCASNPGKRAPAAKTVSRAAANAAKSVEQPITSGLSASWDWVKQRAVRAAQDAATQSAAAAADAAKQARIAAAKASAEAANAASSPAVRKAASYAAKAASDAATSAANSAWEAADPRRHWRRTRNWGIVLVLSGVFVYGVATRLPDAIKDYKLEQQRMQREHDRS